MIMLFEFIAIKENELEDGCPTCYKTNTFLRKFPMLEDLGNYKASKTVCHQCQTPYVAFDEKYLSKEVSEALDKGPIKISGDTKDLMIYL